MKKILNLWSWSWQNIPLLLWKWELYCVEISSTAIEVSRKRFPQCKYFCVSWEDMNFSDNMFDEIYAYDVLEHVTDIDLVMNNIYSTLKDDWFLYVEVPYDKSEYMLLKVNPEYHKQIGHNRVFVYKDLQNTFQRYWFMLSNIKKERGIVNLYLRLIFKLWINITDEMCNVSWKLKIVERCIMACCIWFDIRIFNTWLKYIPLWIITLPIGRVISQIYPKTISFKAYKIIT